jgi:hypothetical protein
MEPNSEVGETRAMRVVIDKLELDLPALPRPGDYVSYQGDPREVTAVTWVIPERGRGGQQPTADDVVVHVQLSADWREGKTDAELHAMRAHPDFEYATTEGPRKQWDDVGTPPADDNGNPDPTWERNTDAGRDGWDRFDYTEASYWRRRRRKGPAGTKPPAGPKGPVGVEGELAPDYEEN